ncbi:zinc metallopeptidase [Merdimmobilis hominis]|jgi:Zn-dependent membrane protease YugP|uniref:Neutral zinc metallopeptidase n=1 Tax=uncultured Anaerotruncus sp. TaxID=905011 RepID=A0A6N2VFR7_9FIRM|nr:zinc metallopeptidase [Merdimmobilis hominis]MCD4837093.1 zinc metallopeptidase [Merdimmobilis hominis]PWL58334.1 MAG: peptidase [Oscillospiraceae bacterium]
MFRYYYGFDIYYLVLILPAMLLGLWAQARVNSTFNRYSHVRCRQGYTGSQIARRILDANGLTDVRIEGIRGNLTDHYDPTARVVRLSDSVYDSPSIAAIGVAAHEVGHAIQHANSYAPLTIRNAIIPVTNIGSKLSIPLILLGVVMSFQPLVTVGIVAFSLMAVFQLITLPVEFNASSRALATLNGEHYLDEEEVYGARKVLSAAALTYVAALVMSLAQLMRLVALFGNRDRD